MIENLIYNERRQKDSIKFFEIIDLYSKNNQIKDEKKLGIIISGRRGHNHLDFSKKLDDAYLNKLLNQDSYNHGYVIEEISRSELKTKKKDRIFYAEISIDKISENLFKDSESILNEINFIKCQSVSEFPSSTRDLSFSIKDLKKYDAVISHLSNLYDENLKDSFIFDFYKNKKLNEIKVGVRLIFQSNKDTLSDDEIQKSLNNLIEPIIDLDGITVPGLN